MQKVTERRARPDPELGRKLAMTRKNLPKEGLRSIRCPNCGFYLLDVYGKDHCFVRVKCRKCKFDETIDTALFRTGRRRGRDRTSRRSGNTG